MMDALTLLIAGCSFAAGVVVGVCISWRASSGRDPFEGMTFTPIGPLTEERLEQILHAKYGLSPRGVRQ
ncbi:MAG: hypothetical protein ACOZAM_15225 [Pseudomonadota bacterium]